MGGRLNLHRIHPVEDGKKAFRHLHPWPSASIVMDGTLEHKRGNLTYPYDASYTRVRTGDRYAMTSPLEWHEVKPIDGPVYTLFYTGTPFLRHWPSPEKAPEKEERLGAYEIGELYDTIHNLSRKMLKIDSNGAPTFGRGEI